MRQITWIFPNKGVGSDPSKLPQQKSNLQRFFNFNLIKEYFYSKGQAIGQQINDFKRFNQNAVSQFAICNFQKCQRKDIVNLKNDHKTHDSGALCNHLMLYQCFYFRISSTNSAKNQAQNCLGQSKGLTQDTV